MTLNTVTTRDERVNILASPKTFTFLDVTAAPVWDANHIYHTTMNTTTNNITFYDDEVDMLWGTYFFLSYTRIEHTR